MAANQKGEGPKIYKLGSHDLSSEGYVVVTNYPSFMKIYKYRSAFRDLSGEIVKFQLPLERNY